MLIGGFCLYWLVFWKGGGTDMLYKRCMKCDPLSAKGEVLVCVLPCEIGRFAADVEFFLNVSISVTAGALL